MGRMDSATVRGITKFGFCGYRWNGGALKAAVGSNKKMTALGRSWGGCRLGGTAGYTRGDVLACMGLLVGRQQPGGTGLVTLLPTCHGVWMHRARPKAAMPTKH